MFITRCNLCRGYIDKLDMFHARTEWNISFRIADSHGCCIEFFRFDDEDNMIIQRCCAHHNNGLGVFYSTEEFMTDTDSSRILDKLVLLITNSRLMGK